MHWKERWELEAKKTYKRLSKLSEQELIKKIENKNLDSYYQIWKVIEKKGIKDNSAIVLWNFLKNNPGEEMMLHRYHCTATLFTIIGLPDPECKNPLRQQVQWDHDGEKERQKALEEFKVKFDLLP